MIEPVREEGDCIAQGKVKRFPDGVVQDDGKSRRMRIAGRRHYYFLARAKNDAAEYAPYRLRETRSGVLRRRTCIGIATIPGRSTAQPVRGKTVNSKRRQGGGKHHEQADQE